MSRHGIWLGLVESRWGAVALGKAYCRLFRLAVPSFHHGSVFYIHRATGGGRTQLGHWGDLAGYKLPLTPPD
jgi:hypothetical protein